MLRRPETTFMHACRKDTILSLSRDARTLLMETASADGDLRMLESQGAER